MPKARPRTQPERPRTVQRITEVDLSVLLAVGTIYMHRKHGRPQQPDTAKQYPSRCIIDKLSASHQAALRTPEITLIS